MNKELIDLAWSVLPKEFKEEVKDNYQNLMSALGYFESKTSLNSEECNRVDLIRGKLSVYNKLFGFHNLTSDAEGEEMLMCEKSIVQQQYKKASQLKDDSDPKWELVGDQIERVLIGLFGSKYLPDNVATSETNIDSSHGNVDSLSQNPPENCDNGNHVSTYDNKPAEPKFKVGDKVLILPERIIGTIEGLSPIHGYQIMPQDGRAVIFRYDSHLEPYTEPKKEGKEGKTGKKLENSQSDRIANCDKHLDTILKDSFRNERRLNIATQIMSAILSNQRMLNNLAHGETTAEGVVKCVVDATMMYTDVLISACEKGGKS